MMCGAAIGLYKNVAPVHRHRRRRRLYTYSKEYLFTVVPTSVP